MSPRILFFASANVLLGDRARDVYGFCVWWEGIRIGKGSADKLLQSLSLVALRIRRDAYMSAVMIRSNLDPMMLLHDQKLTRRNDYVW